YETEDHFGLRQFGTQPPPLHQGRQGRRQTKRQHHGQPRPQSRQRLEKGHVSHSKSDAAADEKQRERTPGEAPVVSVSVDREQSRRETQPPEVRFHPAQQFGRPISAHRGNRKQHGREERCQHGSFVRGGSRGCHALKKIPKYLNPQVPKYPNTQVPKYSNT